MSITYCVVDGCRSTLSGEFSFFRCPLDVDRFCRCRAWKNVLGFTGTHRYANITLEQGHSRLRVCSLHFTENCFVNEARNRLQKFAIPSLVLGPSSSTFSKGCCSYQNGNKKDSSVQTDENGTTNIGCQTECVHQRNESTQTVTNLTARTPRKLMMKEKIRTLEKAAEAAHCEKSVTCLEDVLKFCEGNYTERSFKFLRVQLSMLNKVPKGSRYTDEFKQFALGIHFLGPKAYKKMSEVCRLPSKSTIERFTRRWMVNPGFNDFLFRLTQFRVHSLKEKEKDCVLCIDEISLKSHLFYDISKDKIVGFQVSHNKRTSSIASTALVVMAREIASSWKQPIAYFFYKTSATSGDVKDILFESVRRINATGLNVLGVVSDQGPNFLKLVKSELKLTVENPSFFIDNHKIVYLFDIPHLLKSTRNNLFAYILKMDDGETRKIHLDMMYNHDKKKQFRLAPRLSNDHIYPNNFQKKKVKLASQIFSNSTAVAMHTYIDFNVIPKEAVVTANFIQRMNDLFDVMNSSSLASFQSFMGTKKQINILKEMDDLFERLKVFNYDGKDVTKQLKLINGWRICIKSVLILWEQLKLRGYKYLYTRNLNQDCIENFFGHIRNCCGNAKNPTPIQLARAFKKIFALKYFEQTEGSNCMDDVNEILLYLDNNTPENYSQLLYVPPTENAPLKVFTNDYSNLKSSEGNGLVYVTGYLLKKCLIQHSCNICTQSTNSNDRVNNESIFCKLKAYNTSKSRFGGLTVPSRDFVDYILEMEDIFVARFNELAGQDSIGIKLKN